MSLYKLICRFESSVNSEGIETRGAFCYKRLPFESSVNSEGIETDANTDVTDYRFESSVNSEGIETKVDPRCHFFSLRAV